MSLTKTLQLQGFEGNTLAGMPQEREIDCNICKRKTPYRLNPKPWVFPGGEILALYDCPICKDTSTIEVR
jgi:hypothetical protein